MHLILITLLVMMSALLVIKKWPSLSRQEKTQWSLIMVIVGLGILAITGRMHWLGLAVAGLIAGLRMIVPWAVRLLPLLQQHLGAKAKSKQPPSPTPVAMSTFEALEILGLKEGATSEEIISAHRKLIQKLHPDRDGSTYLASKINQAKDHLLG